MKRKTSQCHRTPYPPDPAWQSIRLIAGNTMTDMGMLPFVASKGQENVRHQ